MPAGAGLSRARTPAPGRWEQHPAPVPSPAGVGQLHAKGTMPPAVHRKDASEARHLLSSAGTILPILIQHPQRLLPRGRQQQRCGDGSGCRAASRAPGSCCLQPALLSPSVAVEKARPSLGHGCKARPSLASTGAGTTISPPGQRLSPRLCAGSYRCRQTRGQG